MDKKTVFFGTLFILGLIDTSQTRYDATEIYNPLNPSEIIEPSIHQEGNFANEEPEQNAKEPTIEKEVYPNPGPPTKQETRFKHRTLTTENVFLEPSSKIKVTIPPSLGKGGNPEPPSHYQEQTYYLLSGTALYGKKVNERENVYVYDVFK